MSVYEGLEKQHRSRRRRKTQPLQAGFRLSGSFEMSMGKKEGGTHCILGWPFRIITPKQCMYMYEQTPNSSLLSFSGQISVITSTSTSPVLQRPTTAPPTALPHTRKAHFLSSICFFLTQIQSLSFSSCVPTLLHLSLIALKC